MIKKYSLLTIAFFLTINLLLAQSNLFLDDSFTVEEMVEDFFNTPNVVTSNVTYTGIPQASSFFDATGTNLEVGAGILLSTGLATSIASPNNMAGEGLSLGTPGELE